MTDELRKTIERLVEIVDAYMQRCPCRPDAMCLHCQAADVAWNAGRAELDAGDKEPTR